MKLVYARLKSIVSSKFFAAVPVIKFKTTKMFHQQNYHSTARQIKYFSFVYLCIAISLQVSGDLHRQTRKTVKYLSDEIYAYICKNAFKRIQFDHYRQ